jgi:hypothetical protein
LLASVVCIHVYYNIIYHEGILFNILTFKVLIQSNGPIITCFPN